MLAPTAVSASGVDSARSVRRRIGTLEQVFRRHYRALRRAPFGTTFSPTVEEWLLDNDYLVGEALERLEAGLDARLLRRLPRVEPPARGPAPTERPCPERRIHFLAHHWVRKTQGRLSMIDLIQWMEGVQRVQPLTLAELWALPAFLTLEILDWLIDALPRDPRGNGELPTSGRVGTLILSLRVLASEDWRTVVEALSLADRELRKDPADAYRHMDFRTRDRYRHALEVAARHAGRDEWEAAAVAVTLADQCTAQEPGRHVGFFLVGEGVADLYEALGARPGPWVVPTRRRHLAGWSYAVLLALLAGGLLAGLLAPVGAALRPVLLLPALIVALTFSVGLGNWLVSRVVKPRPLPRLDFRVSIPEMCQTVVAVPVLISSEQEFEAILHRLQINYHGNSDPALSYVILADLPDAPERMLPGEAERLNEARTAVETLNRVVAPEGQPGPFHLYHRARRWNEGEGVWMGWERKRGKLVELNALLLGAPSELHALVGDPNALRGAPFVITLDADTILPRGAAARMVGTLAHPLNLPRLSDQGRLEAGYSVLQPRIDLIPHADGGTPFSRIFGGVQGLDLYAHAAFDVYQDLFDEAIFAGKGIYHVEAFERVLQARVPENAILSHDLFEGAHGRAGLISDLVLLEDFPPHPAVHWRRSHRWVRGDWQLLPWLARKVPGDRGTRLPNPLSLRARWMILDNLRRSLHAPSALLLLLVYLLAVPGGGGVGIALILVVFGLPVFFTVFAAFDRSRHTLPAPGDLRAEGRVILRAGIRFFLELAFLPKEARTHLDAVLRTVHRLTKSRKHLLQWTTAAAMARRFSERNGLGPFLAEMWIGPALAVLVSVGLGVLNPSAFGALAVAFVAIWLLSPGLAWISAIPRAPRKPLAGVFPATEARALARRTWGYFERFQDPSGHWLPPDNYQEDPNDEIADRTSPTNMAMALTSAVVAWDLGFLGTPHFITRVRNTLGGMERLVRYRGHFLNWYQIRTLEPLEPLYVSTVDSGNLAAALVVVREALGEALDAVPSPARRARGILDTVRVVREVGRELHPPAPADFLERLHALEQWMLVAVEGMADETRAFRSLLITIRQTKLPELETRLALLIQERDGLRDPREKGLLAWVGHLRQDVNLALDELELMTPGTTEGERGGEMHPLRGLTTPHAQLLQEDVHALTHQLSQWIEGMDFQFLYDSRRHLFHIGFSVSEGELDRNHYDLLASEARIASVVAIGKGDVPIRHWLQLGRPFAGRRGGPVLLSWAGTMFEYLMPSLFMHTPSETLLHDGCRRAVELQQNHGRRTKLPWGISESAYHVLGAEGHYQYRAFGVPALGIRRERGARQVVAPYASLMAIGWVPGAVHDNLTRIRKLGGMGPWGPYEALDFGSAGEGAQPHVVYAYMSHHHGMLLAALGNYLGDQPLIRRFHQDRAMATMEPYLMERIPWRRSVEKRWVGEGYFPQSGREREGFGGWSPSLDRSPPPVHLLSNGSLSLQLGARGRGGSTWRGWRLRRGGIGMGVSEGSPMLNLLDLDSGAIWDPLPEAGGSGDPGRVNFAPHRAEFTRLRNEVRTRMTVTVPPRDDLEIRDLRIVNEGRRRRRLRLLLWMDVALAPEGDEERHPAFHKLFVRADRLRADAGVLMERRPRSPEERPPILGATLVVPEAIRFSVRWVVSREQLLGRLGDVDRPRVLSDPPADPFPADLPFHPLDPALGVIVDLQLAPFEEVELSLLLMVAESRGAIEEKLPSLVSAARRRWLSVQARARAEGELLTLGAMPSELPLWEYLLAHVVHPANPLRAHLNPLDPVPLAMPGLWQWGISGDLPILLLLVRRDGAMDLVDSTIRALAWWRGRGVLVDLVVLDEAAGGYEDPVGDRVRARVAELGRFRLGEKGGAHLLAWDALPPDAHAFLRRMAAVVLDSGEGGLEAQVSRWRAEATARREAGSTVGWESEDADRSGYGIDVFPPEEEDEGQPEAPAPLQVRSPWGGFSADGTGYEIRLPAGQTTPAPWANVVAGEAVGFVVTEAGGGFTWAGDAGEFRLTPWSNDPLLDPPGEQILLTDLDTGRTWSPPPGPVGRSRDHRVRHVWGASELEAEADGLRETLTWSLHPDHPVKCTTLGLRNSGAMSRRIQINLDVTWVLGPNPAWSARHLLLAWDPARQTVLARNPHVHPHDLHIGFLLGSLPPRRVEVSHAENRTRLSYTVRLHPGASTHLTWFLGAAAEASMLDPILTALREREAPPRPVGERVAPGAAWLAKLTRVRVKTPDSGLDVLMNGWLGYQTRSSRMLGRTGFYQSGGAFGFRDQLQDAYTMLPLDDRWARAQLVEAARHQFEEGDVLHWWHPGTRRGVRTRCSDDLLWLPFVLAGTVQWTGDVSIVDVVVPFLDAPPLPEGTHERYDLFSKSERSASLWEHGQRALDLAWTRRSPRGLPLIGTGDWNDGMDRVGQEGRGESIWLGWFLARVLKDWAAVARLIGRGAEAVEHEARARELAEALEREGWDGGWYRRAFFDDGTPLGSTSSVEVQIDSIAQSWAVLSGVGDPDRGDQALDSAWEHLVRLEDGLALLLSPPFDGHGPHPGYIAAYPPGVRENGGQYTHAAAWLVGALARAGQGARAGSLLRAILPTRHGEDHGHRYRVEPYVVAADIYGVPPHTGRGGWTWYTGSAGWIFRVVFEEILGVQRRGHTLTLNPCIPPSWPGFELEWQVGGCTIQLRVTNPQGVERGIRRCLRNGEVCPPEEIPIPPEGILAVELEMG